MFVFPFARALRVQAFVPNAGSGRLWTAPTPDDFGRLRSTPDDSGRLRTTSDGFRRFRTALDNAGRTYLPKSVPKLLESDRSQLRIFAYFTHH